MESKQRALCGKGCRPFDEVSKCYIIVSVTQAGSWQPSGASRDDELHQRRESGGRQRAYDVTMTSQLEVLCLDSEKAGVSGGPCA